MEYTEEEKQYITEKEKQIIKCIEKIRPYIQRDGGDVEFSHMEDGIVYVKMHGACLGCSILDSTLKDGIEALLMDEVEGIEEVRLDIPDYYSDPYESLF